MLNIPEAVKALFKADSVRKNFRVVFPDGEYRDLTNSDIVANSVKFTESVCSKTVLQFGLAEASRIEFECVGVPNVYGSTIECYCEIDASTLDAEYQTVKADVPYPVYAIPYGVFRVQSCPRSAGAMSHRRVEAYDIYGGERIEIPPFLDFKYTYIATPRDASSLIQNVPLLMACMSNSVEEITGTDTEVTNFTTLYDGGAVTDEWEYGGQVYHAMCSDGRTTDEAIYRTHGANYHDSLCHVTYDLNDTEIASVVALLQKYGAPENIIESAIGGITVSATVSLTSTLAGGYRLLPNEYIYLDDYGYTRGAIRFNSGLINTVSIVRDDTVIESVTVSQPMSNLHVYRYQMTDTDALKFNVSFKSTGDLSARRSYIDAIDLVSLVEGYAELNAEFRRSNRDGGGEFITLSQSSPIAMDTSEYSEMWWDEYSISPIGSIKYTYHDADLNQEQTMIYSFGAGLSEYDMTSNYLLKNLSITKADAGMELYEYVQGLLDTYFIPNISDIYFTPVDLSAIGLPYLEAGDYLEIDAGDGTTVGTYILSRTLNGEQYLTDDIQSQGGEIIGSTVRSA